MEYVGLVSARQLTADSVKKDGTFYRENKNRLFPVALTLIKGELPGNCIVVDGTIAQRIGLSTEGYTLLTCVQTGVDPVYGEQYQLSALPVSGVTDYLQALKALPSAKIIDSRVSASYSEAKKFAPTVGEDNDPFGK